MRQEHFIARYAPEWDAFEAWLDARGNRKHRINSNDNDRNWRGLRDDAVPSAYRRLCHHLSLARRRGYSPQVTERLQQLTQRGHAVMYRPLPARWSAAWHFLFAGFPRLVRVEWRCMLVALVIFAGSLAITFAALQWRPELIYSVFSPEQIAQVEAMYNPADAKAKLGRESGSDVQMFGYYIYNNISIGFRTFASGLLAGVGSALVLLLNGVLIGAVAGHLQQIGYGDPFLRFVAGHAPLELTAIVIAGGAGLQLGLRLLAPGIWRRRDALIEAGQRGGLLCVGVLAMLLGAAFVEAFWSSIGWMPAGIKYAVSAILWTAVALWLWRGGSGADDAA